MKGFDVLNFIVMEGLLTAAFFALFYTKLLYPDTQYIPSTQLILVFWTLFSIALAFSMLFNVKAIEHDD